LSNGRIEQLNEPRIPAHETLRNGFKGLLASAQDRPHRK
jgi:hypothetical protein